jgi:hypothetical protein
MSRAFSITLTLVFCVWSDSDVNDVAKRVPDDGWNSNLFNAA